MICILLLLFLDSFALVDQAPCINWFLTNGDFVVCENVSLAETQTLVLTTTSQSGFLRQFFRPVYYDTDENVEEHFNETFLVCYNNLGSCDNCKSANFSNVSSSLTQSCNARDCICINITQQIVTKASVGQGFDRFDDYEIAFLDLDSGPYVQYAGNPKPFDLDLDTIEDKRRSLFYQTKRKSDQELSPSVENILVAKLMLNQLSNEEYQTLKTLTSFNPFYNTQPLLINHKYVKKEALSMAKKRSENTNQVVSVFVQFNQPTLTIDSEGEDTLFVWVSIIGKNEMVTCNGSCAFDINQQWLLTSESLHVTIYEGDDEIYSKIFPTIPVVFCPIPSNPFSGYWSVSWTCMNAVGRFMYVSAWFAAVVVLLTIFLGVYKLGKCCWDNRAQASAQVQNFVNTIPSAKMSAPSPVYTFAILSVCMCIASGQILPTCTSTVSSFAIINSCFGSSGSVTCNYKLNVELDFPSSKTTSCLDFFDKPGGKVLYKIKVMLDNVIIKVPLKKKYYTSDYSLIHLTGRTCPGTIFHLGGGPERLCETFINDTSCLLQFDNIGNTCISPQNPSEYCRDNPGQCLPSIRACDQSSNEGCGALVFDDAYSFGQVSMLPTGPIFKVFQPEATIVIPTYKIELTDGLTNQILNSTFSEQVIQIGNMVIRSISVNPSITTLFQDNHIMIGQLDGGDVVAYYGYASPTGVPQIGAVGDIQADTYEALNTLTLAKNQFRFPSNMLKSFTVGTNIDFAGTIRGLEIQRPKLITLPAAIAGGIATIADDTMYILVTGQYSTKLSVSNTLALSFTETVNQVCPMFVDVITPSLGCSLCDAGVTVDVAMYSRCQSGIVTLTMICDDLQATLITTSLVISTVATDRYIIRILPVNELVTCIITATGDGNKIEFTSSILAPELSTVPNATDTVIISAPTSISVLTEDTLETNGFLSWWNSLDGWKNGVKWTVFSIILTIVAIVALATIYWFVRPANGFAFMKL